MNTTPCLPARTDDLASGPESAVAAFWPAVPASATDPVDADDDWAAFLAVALELAPGSAARTGGLVALSH